MTKRRLSAATLLLIPAVLVLVAWAFRGLIADLLVGGVCARLLYGWAKSELGIKPRARRPGRGLLEGAAIAAGGWLAGRQGRDTLAQALRSGAEIQVKAAPFRSRYRR